MQIKNRACAAVFAAALALPGAALAGGFDPNVINGGFVTQDGGANNELTTVASLGFFGAFGEIECGSPGNFVSIGYDTEAPEKASTSERSVKVQDKSQLDISLFVDTATADFDGGNIVDDCKVSATLKGQANPGSDTVDGAKAKLSCDLGPNFSLLSDGVAPPTTDDLAAVSTLCADRKDVKVDTEKGTLDISHDGEPVAPPI